MQYQKSVPKPKEIIILSVTKVYYRMVPFPSLSKAKVKGTKKKLKPRAEKRRRSHTYLKVLFSG